MRWWLILLVLLSFQTAFWWRSMDYFPPMEVVPNAPGEVAVKALSFGENQAFFRLLALMLQNFGDTYGRFTPLKDYDYAMLERWMHLLDTLDNRSDYMPMLASYYFSRTQRPEDVRYLVRYLQDHTEGRLKTKWWWRTQAVYLANHTLKDSDWALQLAKPLQYTADVPAWVQQLPAFMHEQRGEFAEALMIMEHVRDHMEELTPGEINFIRHFIEERIGALDAEQKKRYDRLNPPPSVMRVE